jgi:hypothetical protein
VCGLGRGGDGAMDAANLLKPMLARGELRCIGATTLNEYKKYVEKDPAFERRFQPLYVSEPSVLDTIRYVSLLPFKFVFFLFFLICLIFLLSVTVEFSSFQRNVELLFDLCFDLTEIFFFLFLVSILRGLKERYENHHGVRISDSALVVAAQLAHRYITNRFLPDKVHFHVLSLSLSLFFYLI